MALRVCRPVCVCVPVDQAPRGLRGPDTAAGWRPRSRHLRPLCEAFAGVRDGECRFGELWISAQSRQCLSPRLAFVALPRRSVWTRRCRSSSCWRHYSAWLSLSSRVRVRTLLAGSRGDCSHRCIRSDVSMDSRQRHSLVSCCRRRLVLYLAGALGQSRFHSLSRWTPYSRHRMGGTLLFFSTWSAAGSLGSIARGVVEAGRNFSPLALFGFPSGTPLSARAPEFLGLGRAGGSRLVPLVWAAHRGRFTVASSAGRIGTSSVDRRLAGALVVYAAAAVICR